MIRKVIDFMLFRSRDPDRVRAEVHEQPEIQAADKALGRFYESVRAAERGVIPKATRRKAHR